MSEISNLITLMKQISQLMSYVIVDETKSELKRLFDLLNNKGLEVSELQSANFKTRIAQLYFSNACDILSGTGSGRSIESSKVMRYAVLSHKEGLKGISPDYQLNGKKIFDNKADAEYYANTNSSEQIKFFVVPLGVEKEALPYLNECSLRRLGVDSVVLQQLCKKRPVITSETEALK